MGSSGYIYTHNFSCWCVSIGSFYRNRECGCCLGSADVRQDTDVRVRFPLLPLLLNQMTMEKEYVLEKIRELMSDDSKRPMGVDFVKLKNAVQEDLRKLLNKLLEDGEINYFNTLNGVTIYLKDSKQ